MTYQDYSIKALKNHLIDDIIAYMSPITKSAKKALRQNIKRRVHNLRKKREIKKLLKEVQDLIKQKKIKQAQELLPQVYKKLDKAAKTGLIKPNKSARVKSRITKATNALNPKSQIPNPKQIQNSNDQNSKPA